MKLRDQRVMEEDTAQFSFGLNKANIQVKWKCGDVELVEDDRIRFLSEGQKYTLLIDNCVMGDQAQYSVVLPDGKTSEAKLTVDG